MHVSITFDIDWAPDFIISDLIKLINDLNLKCTFFVTHRSDVLINNLNNSLIEYALHPSFNHSLMTNYSSDFFCHFFELKSIYKNAVGFRSHCLFQSSQIFFKAKELGMMYDSNLLLLDQKNIKPFFHVAFKILRIPYVFSDDTFLVDDNKNKSILSLFDKNQSPYLVFGFHPIHVYLNSESIERYSQIKNDIQNEYLLQNNINTKVKGIKDFFYDLIRYVSEKKINFIQMKEIYEIEISKVKK